MSTIESRARTLYTSKNNAGEGYAPDSDSIDESVRDLVNNYDGEVICRAETTDDVAAVRCGDGEIVLLGSDGRGRNVWAVKATAAELGL